jgi:Ca2+-binding EF-hand superfamily protein
MQYLAYSTSEKVIGLVKMPLDGNPYKSMGLIAHPGEISSFAVSHDGDYLLSAGGSDMTINVWAVNTSVIENACITAAAQSVPDVAKGLVPFLPLLEGGHEGALYEELVDFFYYAQLRCQGEDTTSPRKAEGLVPLSEIPNLMRALGFYPTEGQIKDMCSEIRYSEFSTTAKTVDVVNLEQFIKLYINHRPVLGTTKDQVSEAFKTILKTLSPDQRAEEDHAVDWKTLKEMLETSGEAMPTKELESCLTMLMGRKALAALRSSKQITPDEFAHQMLGFQLEEGPETTPRSRHK